MEQHRAGGALGMALPPPCPRGHPLSPPPEDSTKGHTGGKWESWEAKQPPALRAEMSVMLCSVAALNVFKK